MSGEITIPALCAGIVISPYVFRVDVYKRQYLTRKMQPSPPPPTVSLLTYDESYKAVPPVNTDEEVQRKLLNQAIEQGCNPATDVLAFAKLEEIRAFDRVARWQKENGKPPTVKVIPPDKDREFLAAVEMCIRDRASTMASGSIERMSSNILGSRNMASSRG